MIAWRLDWTVLTISRKILKNPKRLSVSFNITDMKENRRKVFTGSQANHAAVVTDVSRWVLASWDGCLPMLFHPLPVACLTHWSSLQSWKTVAVAMSTYLKERNRCCNNMPLQMPTSVWKRLPTWFWEGMDPLGGQVVSYNRRKCPVWPAPVATHLKERDWHLFGWWGLTKKERWPLWPHADVDQLKERCWPLWPLLMLSSSRGEVGHRSWAVVYFPMTSSCIIQ